MMYEPEMDLPADTREHGIRRHTVLTNGAIRAFWLLLGIFVTVNGASAQEPDQPGALAAALALVDAFNGHDPEAMAALVSSDFELFYVSADGVAELALSGPDQLATEMTGYFTSHPNVESTISAAIDGFVYASFREQIVGGQSSIAVYEVREGMIRRVWYFPAE